MAYDGIITYAEAKELKERIVPGKIEKVYQPGPEDLLVHIHTQRGNVRLFISCNSQSARVCLTEGSYTNPDQPPTFCMLLRKHLQGGRITDVRQKDAERIMEIDIEAQNELGFSVCRRLIVEIMSKHSNIALIDLETGKLIDAIKRISIDVNRYRQLLPGVIYKYPPAQDKLPFKEVTAETMLPHDDRALMAQIAGNFRLRYLFDELLSNRGSEIYLRTAESIGCSDERITIREVRHRAIEFGYLVMGYLLRERGEGDLHMDPDPESKVILRPDDYLVVVGRK